MLWELEDNTGTRHTGSLVVGVDSPSRPGQPKQTSARSPLRAKSLAVLTWGSQGFNGRPHRPAKESCWILVAPINPPAWTAK